MASLGGRFRVRRVSGLLPPFGVTKRIDGRHGCTYLFGWAVGRFVVVGRRFVYRWWPIVDEIDPPDGRDGTFLGRGRLFGFLTFCRFRMERIGD
jgi:hypothetical protein